MEQSSSTSRFNTTTPIAGELDLVALEALSDHQAELLSGGGRSSFLNFGLNGPLGSILSKLQSFLCGCGKGYT